jgi:hypothetical protein
MKRLAVSMWDFSWLLRREGDESEYADWDLVLDELKERGYTCVRIDAFPHLVGANVDDDARFLMRPQSPRFMWGNHRQIEVTPRRGLVAFMRKAEARGIDVALSTWFTDDSTHRRFRIRTSNDLARAWIATLDMLKNAGLSKSIAWVDLCNEFPLPLWMPSAYEEIFHRSRKNFVPIVIPWWPSQRLRAQTFIDEAIALVRAAHPDHRYTFSMQSVGSKNVRVLDLRSLDFLEPHLWLSDLVRFDLKTGHSKFLLPFGSQTKKLARFAKLGEKTYRENPKKWLDRLDAHLGVWSQFAKSIDRELVTSEGWTSVFYDDGVDWGWFKEVSSEAVSIALRHGWRGLCSTNFSQPHFKGVWSDRAWHQQITSRIMKTP